MIENESNKDGKFWLSLTTSSPGRHTESDTNLNAPSLKDKTLVCRRNIEVEGRRIKRVMDVGYLSKT